MYKYHLSGSRDSKSSVFGTKQSIILSIYIYLTNKKQNKNPDVTPVDVKLVLPCKTESEMNADNQESVPKDIITFSAHSVFSLTVQE